MRKRRVPRAERTSELVALHEITTALGSDLASGERLDAALGVVMRELGVTAGAFFLRRQDGRLALRSARGLPPGAPATLDGVGALKDVATLAPGDEAHDRHGLVLLVPIRPRDGAIAVLGLGPRERGRAYGAREQTFLRGVAACAGAPLENSLIRDELQQVHRKLSMRLFELHNLLDVSRDLMGGSPEAAIHDLVLTTVMGHFLVSRCALYVDGPRGLSRVCERGLRRDLATTPLLPEDGRAVLESLTEPKAVVDLAAGPLRRSLEQSRLVLVVPLTAGAQVGGLLAIGERASGMPFSEEDREMAQTLARHALSALESARLRQVREEKQRQDRELQIAREIQQSLFPPRQPELVGFELAALSRPCYEVGGDAYDWMPLGGARLALVIADVAGKGTPASLLMASVHAFLQALAGTLAPDQVIGRLNRFLFASTQAGRFVTLFYAELDTARRQLRYVNAGHVPPFRVAPGGAVSRLREGGPALGLLDDAAYEVGELRLAAGDVVAMVTDGVTEAMCPPDDEEFGDDRVCEALRHSSERSPPAILEELVAAVGAWSGAGGFGDDLTVLILKAR